MNLPSSVKIVEVGPRDGLQNEPTNISTDNKIKLIEQLHQSGLQHIEATSFVSPKKIPQLADHSEVLEYFKNDTEAHYSVLVPNIQGYEAAVAAGAKEIAVFGAVSETFSQKNINCSIDESLERFKEVIIKAKQSNIPVRGYLSCVLGCPYEGDIEKEKVVDIAEQLFQLGCYEISLGDTIGVGTPAKAVELFEAVGKRISKQHLAGHFHDTYGQALVNIFACLQIGIQCFDSSIAGLGGCPYAKGASGNVATEDVIYLMNGLGIETGVDLDKLLSVSQFVNELVQHPPRSKVSLALQS